MRIHAADRFDLESAGSDDDLQLFKHFEERVAQFLSVVGPDQQPATLVHDALQVRLLFFGKREPDHVGRHRLRTALDLPRGGARISSTRFEAIGHEDISIDHVRGGHGEVVGRFLKGQRDRRPSDRLI